MATHAASAPSSLALRARPEDTPPTSSDAGATPGTGAWAPDDPPRGFDPEAVLAAGLRHHHLANTAYPIAHRRTIWRFRQPEDRHAALLRDGFARDASMGLYVHVPFCERRCTFCEYCVAAHHDAEVEEAYFRALLGELRLDLDQLGVGSRRLVGLDIGGGTPALAQPGRVAEVIDLVTSRFALEPGFGISIETTPKVAAEHPERMATLRALGIERISMGLQMINPALLREYGRDLNQVGHNRRAVDAIRRAGFARFNIDLMYGLARQTRDDLRAAVRYAASLVPEYITLYRMRYKGTQIEAEAGGVELDRVVGMAEAAHAELEAAGYHGRPGMNGFSRVPSELPTSEYLTARVVRSTPYLGVGLGAQTFTNAVLAYNLGAANKRLEAYLEAVGRGRLPIQDLYHLPPSEGMAKMVAVSFYFGQVHLGAFRHRFGVELAERFPAEVDLVLRRGLMLHDGPVLRLTPAGARVWNGVVALFYSDRVKEHLLTLEKE
jgi:oxygen-independent coproporphyrinogen-3 oxidase